MLLLDSPEDRWESFFEFRSSFVQTRLESCGGPRRFSSTYSFRNWDVDFEDSNSGYQASFESIRRELSKVTGAG